MKNYIIGWAFIAAILFSACGAHYNNVPTQRLTDQQGRWVLNPGADKPTLVFDSVYKIEPTWYQATQWAKNEGTMWQFWLLAILGPVAAAAIYYLATRKSEARPWLFPVMVLVWGLLWVGAYQVLDSKRWGSEQLIPKTTYDSLIQKTEIFTPFGKISNRYEKVPH